MFDMLAVAGTLTSTGTDPKHADALVAPAFAALETQLVRWADAVSGIIITTQRFL